MVRKIGFGDGDGPKKSVAEAYLDKFRARSRAQARKNTPPPSAPSAPPAKRRGTTILFMMFWLVLWTLGILFVAATLFTGRPNWFSIGWLVLAIFGWFSVMSALIAHLRGKNQ